MITYHAGERPDFAALGHLREAVWGSPDDGSVWPGILDRSLTWVTAFDHASSGAALIGLVNVAWDGGAHASLLDTTVHPAYQRRGIGQRLGRQAAEAARERGARSVHADYEAHLADFYAACGFRPTAAGLLELR